MHDERSTQQTPPDEKHEATPTTPSDAEAAPESPRDVPRWDEAPWAH